MPKINSPAELEQLRKSLLSGRDADRPCIAVCGGTSCHAFGNREIIRAFQDEIKKQSLASKVDIRETGCPGFCQAGPIVVIYPEEICYVQVKPEDAREIVSQTVVAKKVIDRLVYTDPATGKKAAHESEIPFYKNQMRLLMSSNIKIDPKSIEDYLAIGGYGALAKVLPGMSPERVVKEITDSGLRGRSGGGFPAGRKWDAARIAEGEVKYIICNCHEGDPGAFVDRRMMEANPHRIIEGMIIGAYAIGAHEGYIFTGNEFPITVKNTEIAIKQAEEYGLLGKNILGSGFDFSLKVSIDGGNYVCGETTALMASIEGRVGEPVKNYGHATDNGLWGKPTVINNLQTFANVALIIDQGAAEYSKTGTERSKGTMVFSLAGSVTNSGLVEVPMGTPLRAIIFGIGGGPPKDKKFKAVEVGGPLGGFVPESALDLPVDFEELRAKTGVPMAPSLVVLDEDACMVDMVKYFITFLSNESCGKCTPCREGLRQMLKILTRISEGNGREGDIELLEEISALQKEVSLCGLGQGASGPVLSAIKYFRGEFEAHIKEKRCPAQVCNILAAVGK